MEKKPPRSPLYYQYYLYGLTGITCLLACFFLNPFEKPLFCLLLLPPFGAILYLMTRYFRSVRRYQTDYEEMKTQLARQQLLTKRKTRLAAYYDRMLNYAADMIFTLDIDGYILKFNTGAETILGFRQHEIVGKPFTNVLFDPGDSTAIFDLVLKNDRLQNHEVKMKARDGRAVEVSISISEMRDEKNQIMGMVATCKDITENKRLEQELLRMNRQLQELAITDNLSGLFNVRHFHSETTKAFTRLKRNFYTTLTLLLIDIDHFKELNDTAGHQAGDSVIEYVGEIIRTCIRKDLDSGYRYGGDEFTVMLLDTDSKSATVVADRILARFRERRYGATSLSIGIAMANREDSEESLVHRADSAMYTAKRSGGDRYQIFDKE